MSLKHLLFSLFIVALSACSNINIETNDNFEVADLPDGSTVYLNKNSKIAYDASFDQRSVSIEGELYFKVVKGDTPFIIDSKLGQIKVIGTEFNVSTTEEKLEIEVTEGTVELITKEDKIKIKKGTKALYNKTESAILESKATFKFKKWMADLKKEFKVIGKEIKPQAKQVSKESKKIGKNIKKDFKKIKKDLKE